MDDLKLLGLGTLPLIWAAVWVVESYAEIEVVHGGLVLHYPFGFTRFAPWDQIVQVEGYRTGKKLSLSLALEDGVVNVRYRATNEFRLLIGHQNRCFCMWNSITGYEDVLNEIQIHMLSSFENKH